MEFSHDKRKFQVPRHRHTRWVEWSAPPAVGPRRGEETNRCSLVLGLARPLGRCPGNGILSLTGCRRRKGPFHQRGRRCSRDQSRAGVRLAGNRPNSRRRQGGKAPRDVMRVSAQKTHMPRGAKNRAGVRSARPWSVASKAGSPSGGSVSPEWSTSFVPDQEHEYPPSSHRGRST